MIGRLPLRALRGRPWWVPLGALLLVLMVWLSPWHERLTLALDDLLPGASLPDAAFEQALVVDIDESSLRALRPTLGSWPYGRDTYARCVRYLREAGASVVVFNLLFTDPRQGDTDFAAALPGQPPVVLAASGYRDALAAGIDRGAPDNASTPFSLQLGDQPPAYAWPRMALPNETLLAAAAAPAARVGVMSSPLDSDGRLRRLPLLHESGPLTLAALPLAAMQAATPTQALRWDAAAHEFSLGAYRWPVDAQGRFAIALPRNPQAVPTLPFETLARAVYGLDVDTELRQRLRGRAIFIGSSAADTTGVLTPRGQLPGTVVQAAAYETLRQGRAETPAGPATVLLLMTLAWLPAWRTVQRGCPSMRDDLLATALGLMAVLAWAAGALALMAVRSPLLEPLLLLLAGLALAGVARVRQLAAEQRRLDQERALAEAASRAKSEFLANVSHEIRTPMNALLGIAELLDETPLTPEQKRHVEVFRRSGETLSTLINDLLDLAKIEAGRLELRPSHFALRRMLNEQFALLRPQAERKGLRLEQEIAADVPDLVQGDALRLGQVVLNLVGNAIKFTRFGVVRLVVERDPSRPELLQFTVRDTGAGIDRARLEAIFQPFTQADGSVTREYGGTGLGLTITRHLVALMGGHIDVDSTPGLGSTFRFSATLAGGEAQAAAATAPQPLADLLPPEGMTILMAEDNATNVYLVQQMLKSGRHRIDVAQNGAQAVARFQAGHYDLVLMDMQMPVMDGLTATRELRRIEAEQGRPPTPIIALTASAFESDVRASLEAGCSAHLSKPLRMATLLETIAQHVRPGAGSTGPASPPPGQPPSRLEPPVDAAAAIARMGGDPALYRAVVERALPILADWNAAFTAALASGQRDDAYRLAHDLKGMSAMLGANALSAHAEHLQTLLRDPQANPAEAQAAVVRALPEAERGLRRWLAQP